MLLQFELTSFQEVSIGHVRDFSFAGDEQADELGVNGLILVAALGPYELGECSPHAIALASLVSHHIFCIDFFFVILGLG